MSEQPGRHEAPPATPLPVPTDSAWRRLRAVARPKATKANAFAALLALVLGFAIATQVVQTQEQGLESLRQSDLVGILDNITQSQARLDAEARSLQTTRDQLVNGSSAAALEAARARLDSLGVLAGTLPASGPGITLTIGDPQHKVTAPVLLDALEELRDAGAEAVQIGPVRVVASTSFTDAGTGIDIDGTRVEAPYTITAIGDAPTMAAAMDIPGGIVETVRGLGAEPRVTQSDNLRIDALQTLRAPRYARPVPTATPSP